MEFGGLVAFIILPIYVCTILGFLAYEKIKERININKNRKPLKYGTEVIISSGFYEGFSGKIYNYTYYPFKDEFEYTIELIDNQLVRILEENLKK